MTTITGKFQPWVPNYGYHSWTLKGKRDKELMEYLVKRNTDGRFVSNDYSLPTSEDIRIDPEKPFVKDTLDEILEKVRTVNDKLSIMKSNFGSEVLGQVNYKGGSTAMHKHENCFAFVYYVNAPKDCGMLNWYINYDTKFEVCKADPASKSLLFFPGWVPHFTMRNQSDEPRVVLAGNLDFGGSNV